MDRHLKTNRISTGYNRVTVLSGPIQSGGTSTMAVDKVSRRLIAKGQYFRNLGRWSWMLLQSEIIRELESLLHTAHRNR